MSNATKTFKAGTFTIDITPATTLAPSAFRRAVKEHGLKGAEASKACTDFLAWQRTNFADAIKARNDGFGSLITLASGKDWLVSARMAANGRSLTVRANFTGTGSIAPRTLDDMKRAIETLNVKG